MVLSKAHPGRPVEGKALTDVAGTFVKVLKHPESELPIQMKPEPYTCTYFGGHRGDSFCSKLILRASDISRLLSIFWASTQ